MAMLSGANPKVGRFRVVCLVCSSGRNTAAGEQELFGAPRSCPRGSWLWREDCKATEGKPTAATAVELISSEQIKPLGGGRGSVEHIGDSGLGHSERRQVARRHSRGPPKGTSREGAGADSDSVKGAGLNDEMDRPSTLAADFLGIGGDPVFVIFEARGPPGGDPRALTVGHSSEDEDRDLVDFVVVA